MKSSLTAIQIEGNLLAPDMTAQLLEGSIKGQAAEDFGLSKTDKLADEIANAWGDAKAYWAAFQRALERLDENDSATSITREMWAVPLLRSLGYTPIYTAKAEVVDGQTYAISHRADVGENKPPIHIVGCRLEVDKRPPSGTPRLSPHALVQEYLNKTEHLWAIATNGFRWRLLRDSSLMTRLTYIEFDLEQILKGENFAEFGLFYRLFHRSRLPEGVDDADKCLLEYYHQEALQQGGRVRDKLRDGVEKALIQLGTGFLQHSNNEHLRQKFVNGSLKDIDYYRQLLRLIYRLLFLMVAESRKLLFVTDDLEKARIYREYYSIERLRELAERPQWRREGFQDLWQGLRVTFLLFDEDWRGKVLGLSPLNGDLFGSKTLTDLDDCAIDNYDLLQAIRHLSLYQDKAQLRRVNYEFLDVEELGSVYESLLDFHPEVTLKNYELRITNYEFKLVFGSDRKTTGSYYTPPQLVQQLIKTALEPVIEEKLRQAEDKTRNSNNYELRITNYELSLLSLKVCDPACGSGHFLLAAARRIGKELAKVRTGEAEPGSEPLKLAIRDVIQNCIYGVDLNPLAVDLCKVALWIEGFPGKLPLTFLDHRIKCGNSLVGVLDINCLDEGIPDEAYKAVTGDDKKLATQLKKRNKKERETDNQGQLSLFGGLEPERTHYVESARELGHIPEATPQQVKEKQARYQQSRNDSGWWRDYSACNLWTAAFFMPLTEQNLQLLPTTAALFQLLNCNLSTQKIVDAANKLAEEKHFFHWCLEFPEVFEKGGFDCVVGNPPWEKIQVEEQPFFANRDSTIAKATGSKRKEIIKNLQHTNPNLYAEFESYRKNIESIDKFIKSSTRYALTGIGKMNTYATFSELAYSLLPPKSISGLIVPLGIATDDNNKNFFATTIKENKLLSFFGFENEALIFSEVHHSFKFAILILSGSPITSQTIDFAFYCRRVKDINDDTRRYQLASTDIIALNPNTITSPVFRTKVDANLTKKIYSNFPVIDNENTGSNPWQVSIHRMLNQTDDSSLFNYKEELVAEGYTLDGNKFIKGKQVAYPVYEAKMIHQYDHRFGTYDGQTEAQINQGKLPEFDEKQHSQQNILPIPKFWLRDKYKDEFISKHTARNWLLVYRDITSSVVLRTAIAAIIPRTFASETCKIIYFQDSISTNLVSCFLANINSLTFDYCTRQKVSGNHLSSFIFKQLPIIPPHAYTQKDIDFITPRVLELVYTAWDMQPFAKDMGYDGDPFIWNSNRRALLRVELDAYYAKLYGLSRDELRYILDPADVYGEDFPSETFRVLKNNEIKQFGEYRTQRLVLEAWDRMFS